MRVIVALMFALAALGAVAQANSPAQDLSVDGNRLVARPFNSTASPWRTTRVRGVAATGALFECVQGRGMFDGATGVPYMTAIKKWGIEIIRVPTNEDCWLGVNEVKPQYSGAKYQTALAAYVDDLLAFGFNVILELHWTASGTAKALGQQPMPDAQHAVPFWRQMAATFGKKRGIVFDLFNEPYPQNNTFDSVAAWQCWKHGGSNCTTLNYTAAGMQLLVDTVRDAGSENVLMLGGINYSNSLTRWVEYKPRDPLDRLAASWHSYSMNLCNNVLCWELFVKPVMQHVPVIVGEIGEVDCKGGYITPLMD